MPRSDIPHSQPREVQRIGTPSGVLSLVQPRTTEESIYGARHQQSHPGRQSRQRPGREVHPERHGDHPHQPATTSVRKDKDGNQQERTEWHRVVFFGKLGEIAGEYLRKGSSVYVEGSLRYDKYTGRTAWRSTPRTSSPMKCRCWAAAVKVAVVATTAAIVRSASRRRAGVRRRRWPAWRPGRWLWQPWRQPGRRLRQPWRQPAPAAAAGAADGRLR